MTKKEIRRSAQRKILDGKSRQEVFEELLLETKKPGEEIAKIVRFIPTLENRKKFKTAQGILIGLMVLMVLLKVAAVIPLIMEREILWLPVLLLIPIFYILLLIGVVTHRGESYRLIALIFILGLLRSFFGNLTSDDLGWLLVVDLVVLASLIGLGLFLNAKLVSDYSLVKEKYTNDQGQVRLRNKIRFKD